MGQPMKGLTQFIADLRNTRAEEEENRRINTELVNIQKQFLAPNLNGYQRKKYVCKLIYIYILGHLLTFGYMEAIQLLSSKVYSEKEIGYLAVSLLLNEKHEMMALLINSIKSDLEVDNYDMNALALHVIATIGNEELALFLGESVFQLLRSPTTPPFVKKKAALALLRLIKVSPELLVKYQASWLPRIVALMDQNDSEVGLAVVALVSYIAKTNPNSVKICIPLIVRKLHKLIIDKECPEKYIYNGIPAPWLTVKLFNLVEDLILIPNLESGYSSVSNIDIANLSKLRHVVAKAIENGRRKAANQQALNVQSAILFSAVSLATRLDPSPDAISGVIDALSVLLGSKETNTRYLALNSLIKIVSGSHVDRALLDTDIAKSDDINVHNSIKKHTAVVLKLLRDKDVSVRQKSLDALFLICDFQNIEAIAQELLVYLSGSDYLIRTKISSKIYHLIEKYSTDLTWYVVNTLKILTIAGSYASPNIWHCFVKVIVNSSSNELKAFACKSAFRSLKLDTCTETIVKLAGFLLGEYGHLLDSDETPWEQFVALCDKYFISGLQTRYIILNTFLKFYKKHPDLKTPISKFYRQELNSINTEIQQRSVEYIKLISRSDNLINIVVDEMPEFPIPDHILTRLEHSESSSAPLVEPLPIVLSPNWQAGYYRLLMSRENLFFENSLLKIYLRFNFDELKSSKKITLFLGFVNSSPTEISSFITSINMVKSTNPSTIVKCNSLPESNIPRGAKTTCELETIFRTPFDSSESPVLEINFLCGGFTSLKLKLPIVLIKSLSPTALSEEHFTMRWNQLGDSGNPNLIKTQTVQIVDCNKMFHSVEHIRSFLLRTNWGECIDNTEPQVLKFGGIIHTSTAGNFGTLVKVEKAIELFIISVRSTKEEVPHIVLSTIVDILTH